MAKKPIKKFAFHTTFIPFQKKETEPRVSVCEGVRAANEKEARLKVIKIFNRQKYRVLKIEKIELQEQ